MKHKKAFEAGIETAIKNGHKGLLDILGIHKDKWEHSLWIMDSYNMPKRNKHERKV